MKSGYLNHYFNQHLCLVSVFFTEILSHILFLCQISIYNSNFCWAFWGEKLFILKSYIFFLNVPMKFAQKGEIFRTSFIQINISFLISLNIKIPSWILMAVKIWSKRCINSCNHSSVKEVKQDRLFSIIWPYLIDSSKD